MGTAPPREGNERPWRIALKIKIAGESSATLPQERSRHCDEASKEAPLRWTRPRRRTDESCLKKKTTTTKDTVIQVLGVQEVEQRFEGSLAMTLTTECSSIRWEPILWEPIRWETVTSEFGWLSYDRCRSTTLPVAQYSVSNKGGGALVPDARNTSYASRLQRAIVCT
ncbi:hypothetical protein MRX96_001361 [Rhipicephalus microplus]